MLMSQSQRYQNCTCGYRQKYEELLNDYEQLRIKVVEKDSQIEKLQKEVNKE